MIILLILMIGAGIHVKFIMSLNAINIFYFHSNPGVSIFTPFMMRKLWFREYR